MSKILVSGGTGYIGSHTIVQLIENGYEVISIDNYINSSPAAIPAIEKITNKQLKNYEVDLCDIEKTTEIFNEHPDIVGIIHFAALKAVGESVEKPVLYYRNNLNSLLNLLECCIRYEIPNFIFSSSCSVYGNTKDLPVTEDSPLSTAESPYAHTKQVGEDMVRQVLKNAKTQSILLRYFNPAGAHPSGFLGESPIHAALSLVPIIAEVGNGKRKKLTVHGDDYQTRDGSCIRDYIHIVDLSDAHIRAMEFLIAGKQESQNEIFNLGIGKGVSVLEAINAFEKVSNTKLNYKIGPRREGDVVAVYADYSKAKELLGWEPKYNIQDIMSTAWAWEKNKA